MSANSLWMKKVNKAAIRNALKSMKKATKHELAMKTGLSVVTIQSLLQELITENEVLEGETLKSGGGRPSAEYIFHADFAHAIIIYGMQKNNLHGIHLVVVNLDGTIVFSKDFLLAEVEITSFDDCLEEALALYKSVRIIGFGLPGEEQDGKMEMCDYENLVGEAFKDHLVHKFLLPIVFCNDINAAVLGYSRREPSYAKGCTLGIYFPRIFTPGAGIVMDGVLYRGKNDFAGEIGFLPYSTDWSNIDYQDEVCVTEKISALLAMYACILAPDRVILYGDFVTAALCRNIKLDTQKKLQQLFSIQVSGSKSMESDFAQGMIHVVLTRLESKYQFTQIGDSL